MMRKLLQSVARRKQFHTLISQETIKPSSPTPSHLKTYNLSLRDQFFPPTYIPLVFFYPNYGSKSTQHLKNSLSQTLTQYFPFSGKLVAAKDGPFVDCNDEGVEFLEARIDASLSDVVDPHKVRYEPVDQFFPNGTVWGRQSATDSPVKVQLSHFNGGGLAVAVAVSHQIGDGSALCSFIDHWAKVTSKQGALPSHLIQSSRSLGPEFGFKEGNKCVSKKFVFPNTKIEQLKAEIMTLNPTRVEVVNSILYRSAVRAAKGNPSNFFQAFVLAQTVNMRKRMADPLPETAVGNFSWAMMIPTMIDSELDLASLVGRIKKMKAELNGVTTSQLSEWQRGVVEASKDVTSQFVEYYVCSSMCRYPVYEIDFGWGKPSRVTFPGSPKNLFILMDTPSGDGIEAIVTLEEEDMAKFQDDEKLLALAL